jgi:3-methylfumaryl-CoA hydratase
MNHPGQMSQTDYISSDVLNRMGLTLDDNPGFEADAVVPHLWHWLFFLPHVKTLETGPDGHPKTGRFIPKIKGLDRRMWAGSRFWFHGNLLASRHAQKDSQVVSVTEKQGKSGRLGFVLVTHEIYQDERHILTEEQDIVYKQAPESDTTVDDVNASLKPPGLKPQWSKTYEPDPVLLFKYSALTFNGHRIHYDRDFCINEFGFPGLVVHGPLLAILMMELLRKNMPQVRVSEYVFRAKGPIFDFQTFNVQGAPEGENVFLWVENNHGLEAMTARAKIRHTDYKPNLIPEGF